MKLDPAFGMKKPVCEWLVIQVKKDMKKKISKNKHCNHVYRSGQLHKSIVIGGGGFLGECTNECFPGLIVCYEHASKETLALLARFGMQKDLK